MQPHQLQGVLKFYFAKVIKIIKVTNSIRISRLNVEKTKVMRISRQPSPVTIIIDQKRLENVECFKYLGSMLTNDGR